jgi:hypothetical protein
MEEVVKRHILESFREKYHRAGKLAKGELLKETLGLGWSGLGWDFAACRFLHKKIPPAGGISQTFNGTSARAG